MSAIDPRLARPDLTQVAVITGAAGGIGTATARLLGHTHRLILTDADRERLHALHAALTDEGCRADCLSGDLGDADTAQALAELCARTGPLRSIVNAAGLSPVQADWQTIIRANSIGPVRLLAAIEPLLTPGSACVLIASVAGHLGPQDAAVQALLDDPLQPDLCGRLHPHIAALVAAHGGTLEGQAYSLSKRAIIRLCEQSAPGWGRRGARIVSLSPGVVWTPMGRREAASGKRAQAMVDATPCGRWGTAMDIATAAQFLLSDAASYITGCDLRVDGGAAAALRGTQF
ncbi:MULTISPECIES: SDR family oxidoreductase [Pseudomonadota]|jgi:NAD(P)-dependent dehydrogenase (short-subunit alcohol dehydrogenase family)|uniref:SDR family oxidoreductase n=1 Tax=Pseudomonadota TaxID=1224 RepID=UPI00076A8728|nr:MULTISPECIES: SDR family oxidoreductase [Pseudomonadota]